MSVSLCNLYIESASFQSVILLPFCLSPRGQTFLTHRGDKHFYTERGGGQTFYVRDVGGDDDVGGEEEDVSEANILVSKASKLSAGARISRGPWGPEILVAV